MGIGRDASNKPAKMAAKSQAAATRRDLPEPLVSAVECLERIDPARPAGAADADDTPPY
jgi:hypothetical protein